jgi:hypothetical protein
MDREAKRLSSSAVARAPQRDLVEELTRCVAPSREVVLQALQHGSRDVLDALRQVSQRLQTEVEKLQETWRGIRTEVNRGQFLLFQVRGSRRVAGQAASLLSVDKRWFWLFGVVAVATLLGVVLHDRRHEIRRMLNGGRARAMGLSEVLTAALAILVLLTLTTFILEDHIYEWLLTLGSGQEVSPRQTLIQHNTELEEQIRAAQQSQQQKSIELDQARQRAAAATPAGQVEAGNGQAQQFHQQAAAIWTSLALLESLPPAIRADVDELQGLRDELTRQTQATIRYLRLREGLRGALGVVLLSFAAGGGILFWQGVTHRRRLVAETCPLCLGTRRLESDSASSATPHARDGARMLKCRNLISQRPREECQYSFPAAYRSMVKLCFPTLGVPQAGKTHWLSMIYWELNRGNYPQTVQFEKIKSRSSADFDRGVEEILTSRIGTAATQRDRIPHPLVFNFRDHDRWSRSNLLVNIFDYSGEVTADMGVDDYRRRRALEADGYFFFLDPTFPTEPQAKAVNDFREDLRLVKGVRTGRSIRAPVALCVTKIDLLANQSYALPGGGDAIARFYAELARIDPTGESLDRRVLEARSRLTARLRETIWPGWHIERQVHELFGGRYMFFPLSPVGLDGRGETDLSLRTIAPFGLLEPLAWLLEMSGYPVLG